MTLFYSKLHLPPPEACIWGTRESSIFDTSVDFFSTAITKSSINFGRPPIADEAATL
jgi:hypothetical protein